MLLNCYRVVLCFQEDDDETASSAQQKPAASRRTSFGFLRRVSQALKSRQSMNGHGLQRDDMKRHSSKREKNTENKENPPQKPRRFDLLRRSKKGSIPVSSAVPSDRTSSADAPQKNAPAPLGSIENKEVQYKVYRKIGESYDNISN